MTVPSVRNLPSELKHAAVWIADRLSASGHRAWIVGGAVRDLALQREVRDVDVATAATPDEIEGAFGRTFAVGRSFGTVVVPIAADRAQVRPQMAVEVTTFRTEDSYGDGRRPDRVNFGATLEEDASRRDFTCNALYLDPLTDELRDPEGGQTDLERGLLRTVGDATQRFDEDGLRLLRLARFEAALGLQPAPGLHRAARSAAQRLSSVSVERILAELQRMLAAAHSLRAMTVLAECELLPGVFPGLAGPGASSGPETAAGAAFDQQLAAHARLPDPPGPTLGLASWLHTPSQEASARALRALRPSRELLKGVEELWRHAPELVELATSRAPRSSLIRALRAPAFPAALELACAWHPALEGELRSLAEQRASFTHRDLHPEPWIVSADLRAAGIPPGPRYGELLTEAETRQLDGDWTSREQALRWLSGEQQRRP